MQTNFVLKLINSLKMKTIESNLRPGIIEAHNFIIGNLYLFENIAVSEIHEGKHLCLETANDYLSAISKFYGNKKSFGYISNRINSFSIEALEFPEFIAFLKNLKAFSTITYKNIDDMTSDIERQFCPIPYEKYDSLYDGFICMNKKLSN